MILLGLCSCQPAAPPLPVTNDPINCHTYRSHNWAIEAALAQIKVNPGVLDDHNINEANAAACRLGSRRNSLGPR